ncbi:MAG: TonB-dependent receptor [Thermodesulfobacteriota bacterium]|nr:TonB-dependent receptor [Thermodesulfobacteriota bacterium]
MNRYSLKESSFLLSFIITLILFLHTAAAQSQEEMDVLRMFYKEKDLVITATRHPKPISQVAENITVITATQIEQMNAHTLADILNRIPGIFVNFNQDFGASSLLYTQGSDERHMLVIVDGIPWNFLNSGAAETHSIPVGIIERIEIIKGPASSAWGSSLGGVINVITKQPKHTKSSEGMIRASYGERDTVDYGAEISGSEDPVGFYLFAGRQDSDGLKSSRGFDTYNLYSKVNISVTEDTDIGLSIGYSEPDIKIGDFPSGDISQTGDSRTFFGTTALNVSVSKDLSLNLSTYLFRQRYVLTNDALGFGFAGPAGELFLETGYDEETAGIRGKIVFTHGKHTAVFGADYDHGELDQTIESGALLQFIGIPDKIVTAPDTDRWAVFFNETIIIDRLSITPGIRYDHNSVTGSFVSPSLGLTCRLGEDSILRTSVARGFTIPPLSWSSGGALFLDPNPGLDPEEIWSYQTGMESTSIRHLWTKATVFYHRMEDAMVVEYAGSGPPTFNDIFVNRGKVRRKGFEFEAETDSKYRVSFGTGFAYVDLSPSNDSGSGEIYAYNLSVKYNDKGSLKAELFGQYVWWDLDSEWEASYDDLIWDFNLNKEILSKDKTTTEFFFTAHNLFNGFQYYNGDSMNPKRWVEGGIKLKFH